MNFRQRFYKPALVALALVLFCGVFRIQQLLNLDRTDLGFTKIAPLENAPPVLAFTTVALGGFRGLIANALWIRASNLQEEDKFFEMVQLSDWITKLEPHFTQVWINQAWNMAYNISVKFQAPEDRYRWLQRGIALLRDEGIPLNPDEATMYRELSWLFQNKMGKDLDDAHFYYKQEWLREMQTLFVGNANIPELLNPTTDLERQRVKLLHDKYKMDPKIMQDVDNVYGPFEWRLPDAHAVYWAEAGRRKASGKDQDTLRRSIYQSMQQACYLGQLTQVPSGDSTNSYLIIGPYLNLVPKVNAAYEKMISEDEKTRQNMIGSHRNFLRDAIFMIDADGRRASAKHWFDYLQKTYPGAIAENLSLDDYVIQQTTEKIAETDKPKVTTIIMGALRNHYVYLARDENDSADHYYYIADKIYTYYQSIVPKNKESKGRIGLDPFASMQKVVLNHLLAPESEVLTPQEMAVLRTRLQMPIHNEASTNAPATAR